MGLKWISAFVIFAFYSGVLGEISSTDLRNAGSLNRSSIVSSIPIEINKSENNNTDKSGDVIEIVDSNSGTKYESLSRFNYTSFDRNISTKKKLFSDEKQNTTYLKTSKSSKTNSGSECSDSSDDFPKIFSIDVLKHGALAVVILIGIYCFTALAIICDKYFLPCMEVLCDVLNLPQDVAAATFMSVATSTPELFVNIIGTFITKSDLGVGTIVGSSLFNSLGVASIGSLAAAKPIQLNWWPLTRDTIIYMFAVCLLITITYDNVIFWYEGLILFMIYFLYFTIMFNNHRIWNFINKNWYNKKENTVEDKEYHGKEEVGSVHSRKVSTISPYGSYMEDVQRHSVKAHPKGSFVLDKNFQIKEDEVSNVSRKESTNSPYGSYMEDAHHVYSNSKIDKNLGDMQIKDPEKDANSSEDVDSIFNFPREAKFWRKCFWVYIMPIKLVLRCVIPDPKTHPKLFPLTFIMCIIFIGLNSYLVSWMITLTGTVLGIPDAVLGFTFLAAGGCLPETISITIMSRRGEGSMGVSNSLGANTMNILMSLGLPWFLKTILMGTDSNAFIRIKSGSMEYIIMGLLVVAAVLYLTLYLNNFQLRKRGGVILLMVYSVFVTASIVAEMLTTDCW